MYGGWLGAVSWYKGIVIGVMAGVAAWVCFGVIASFAASVWPYYVLTRTWLVLRRQLPWQLMDFLADAHRRGVLRQAGAVYQFRHIELQHRLANRDKQRANASAASSAGA